MNKIMIILIMFILSTTSAFAIESFRDELFENINAELINEQLNDLKYYTGGWHYGETDAHFEAVRKAIADIVDNNDNYRQTVSWQRVAGSEYAMFHLGTKRVAVFYKEGKIILAQPPCCEPTALPF